MRGVAGVSLSPHGRVRQPGKGCLESIAGYQDLPARKPRHQLKLKHQPLPQDHCTKGERQSDWHQFIGSTTEEEMKGGAPTLGTCEPYIQFYVITMIVLPCYIGQ